jgi:hypothetical protein
MTDDEFANDYFLGRAKDLVWEIEQELTVVQRQLGELRDKLNKVQKEKEKDSA